jgi:hypothetical protein
VLDIELVPCANVERATEIFLRDGFVAVEGVLAPEQLVYAQEGARRVVEEQTSATSFDKANRGYARYSFGQQVHHPEWAMLVDLPTILPIIGSIWDNDDFTATGAGGDYSLPGADVQHLHSDMRDPFNDPLQQVNIFDMPTPFIVVNYLMTEFAEVNGAIRFVPGTQRTRLRPPALEDEPEHWKRSIACAPAGTAIVRDVRCWHGGTPNRSDAARIMTSAGCCVGGSSIGRARSTSMRDPVDVFFYLRRLIGRLREMLAVSDSRLLLRQLLAALLMGNTAFWGGTWFIGSLMALLAILALGLVVGVRAVDYGGRVAWLSIFSILGGMIGALLGYLEGAFYALIWGILGLVANAGLGAII